MSEPVNVRFVALVDSIKDYCSMKSRLNLDHEQIETIARTLKDTLPNIAKSINGNHQPDVLCIQNFIAFGVEGRGDELEKLIWKEHFLGGASISDVAKLSSYASKSVTRRIKVFPDLIAEQLWRKDNEQQGDYKISPSTREQRLLDRLQDEQYRLSPRQAEVVTLYTLASHPLGRRQVADLLSISDDTLKSHHGAICRKMKVKKVNDAVAIAKKILEDDSSKGGNHDPPN